MTVKLRPWMQGLSEGTMVHFKAEEAELPCRAAFVVKVTRERGKREEIGRDEDDEPIYKQHWLRPDSGSVLLEVFYSPEDLTHVIGNVVNHAQQRLATHGHETGQWHTLGECPNDE